MRFFQKLIKVMIYKELVALTLLSAQPVWGAGMTDYLGMTYFTFFDGPGLAPGRHKINPNQLGRATDDGLGAFNVVSLRYKFHPIWALDFQSRFKLLFNNGTGNPNFSVFRWESPRIGVSGKLMSGEDWILSGAINTDFPSFFPAPFSGYTSRARKVLFNPGLFANFRYRAKGSPWSIFAVLSPRYFFYGDRTAAESQMTRGGFVPGNKAELSLSVSPTINYQVSSFFDLSLGTSIDYRKQVLSAWNPLLGSLRSNGSSKAWRLSALPIMFGGTMHINSQLNIFPYIQTYPIAGQRINAKTGEMATLLQSTAVGMWVNGTLF